MHRSAPAVALAGLLLLCASALPARAANCVGVADWNATHLYNVGDHAVFKSHLWTALVSGANIPPDYCPACNWWRDEGACGGAANQPPSVSLTAPANGATFNAGSNITVSANASDSDGSVAKVEFFRGTTSLGVDTSAPYSVVFANAAAGSYTLKAVATDNAGAATTSATVSITVNTSGCTVVPSVPGNLRSTAKTDTTIDIAWNASSAGSGCSIQYQIFRNNTLIQTQSGTTFHDTGRTANTTFSYFVKAVDQAGTSGQSNTIQVTTNAGGGGAPTAAELLAKITTCSQISNGLYRSDSETAATIPMCQSTGAIWWKADMDIDCDGVRTTQCNENTDPFFQADTSAHQSNGQPMNAATMPYMVIPSPSSRFNFGNHNIALGAVVAVIFNNQVEYAVFADTGPVDIIGEASFATAQALGIDPDPATGGSDGPVAYIVFQGSQVTPIESHSAAVTLGQQLARQFVNNN
jgi:chitodextrinase